MTTIEKIRAEIRSNFEDPTKPNYIDAMMRNIGRDECLAVIEKYAEQEQCEVSEYDKDHIWYKGHQYISLRRFLEVKAEAEQEPMREFTEEEAKSYSKALDKMYKPTGFNVFDEPCDDAISREMALKECHDIVIEGERYRVIQEETLLGLPSVTQKSGKWITEKIGEGHKVYCSECKESANFEYARDGDIYSSYGHGVIKKTKYCPNCGARMVEPQERSK